MTSFQTVFAIFDATDVPGLIVQLNDWGRNIETAVSELRSATETAVSELRSAILEQGARTEAATAELNRAVLMQGGDLATLRDGLVLMEQHTAGISQFGNQAVAELDVLMKAFRAELVLSKTEQQQLRFQEAEALKTELRAFVAQVETRFAAVEAEVNNFKTRPLAPDAATDQDPWWTRKDPWWQQSPQDKPQAPWSGGAGAASPPENEKRVNFAMDVDDSPSPTPAGPPGVSPEWQPAWMYDSWGFSEPQGWQPRSTTWQPRWSEQ